MKKNKFIDKVKKKEQLREGDTLQIKGTLGFLLNPIMKVIEVKNGLVLLEDIDAKEGGLLSSMNRSWHGIDTILIKL